MSKKQSVIALLGLYIVLFIDGLGQGILFPLLTKTLVDPHVTIFVQHASQNMRNFLYAVVLGAFFLTWFFGAVIMGEMSDGAGRKKTLLICMAGAGIAYFLTGLAFVAGSLCLVILGRVIAGLTAGSQPIAQAVIVDVSTKENLHRNIGLIMMSITLGLIIGPLVGSFLADSNLVSWFDNTTPMYFSALLSLLNFALLLFFFKETSVNTGKVQLKLSKAIDLIVSACKHKKIRHLSAMYFLFQFGWIGFYSYSAIFLLKRYHFSSSENGLFLALVGLGLTLGFTVFVRVFAKVSAKKLIMSGYGLLGVVVLLMAVTHSVALAWAIVIPGAVGVAVGVSYTISTYSSLVEPERQGWIMGVNVAVAVLAGLFGIMLNGFIADLGNAVPMLVSFAVIALGVLVSLSFKA